MKLTLEALQVLDAIDKKGSFAGAALALYKVPSTITYTIQKLEEDLGFVIFRREGRRSILTPAGLVLLEQGRELLLSAQRIIELAHQANSGWESSITLSLDTTWDANLIYPIITEFYQLGTGVEVNVNEEVMGGSLEALVEKKADIVIGGPPPLTPLKGIKFKQLITSNWLFVVAKDHPLRHRALPLTAANIKPYPSIVIKDSSRNTVIKSHRIFEQQLQLRVPTMQHKIDATIQGAGVGFLPEHKILSYLHTGELVALDIDKEAPDTPHYCSWQTSNKGKAMRWFVDKILALTPA